MKTLETVERRETSAPGSHESHIPRDDDERPLKGLCGYVAQPSTSPRKAGVGEHATCIVCRELWDAGWRP